MKELEELTADIREKLPRLMEKKKTVIDDGSWGILLKKEQQPMFNDVIDWIRQTSDPYKIDLRIHLLLLSWDMSKSSLKDQSPELIKFLHGLIKK